MKVDIKILEDYIELCKTTGMDKARAKAIENLIARNKELLNERDMLIKERDYYLERYIEFNNAFMQGRKKLTEE